MLGKSDKNPELYDLSTVAVAVFSGAPETLRQRANLKKAGSTDISSLSAEGLQAITQQKVAVIFDAETDMQTVQEKIGLFEAFIEANPEASVRFFFLYWPEDDSRTIHIPGIFHIGERFECLNIDSIEAEEIPVYINEVLYKARLPLFLRKGYKVEISDKLKEIEGTYFRPITICSPEYTVEMLYIHNKRLYREKPVGKMEEITGEKYLIMMKRSGSKLNGSLPVDTLKTEE